MKNVRDMIRTFEHEISNMIHKTYVHWYIGDDETFELLGLEDDYLNLLNNICSPACDMEQWGEYVNEDDLTPVANPQPH